MYTNEYMIEVKKKISENLLSIVKEMGVDIPFVIVDEPTDLSHGDLTSNVALQISKMLSLSTRDIAETILNRYPKDVDIEKIEVAGPGFLNFFLSKEYLLNKVESISKNGISQLDLDEGKKYIIEYTDPNPFKILHIGHLYTNMVGESFARLREALGASVVRANYQGDVGLHVAKTMYGLKLLFARDGISFEDLKSRDLVERVKYLGEAYMLGFNMYDDVKNPIAIEQVKNINYFIFSLYIPSLEKKEYFRDLKEIEEWYYEGRDWCMEYFERIYERTNTKFDKYFLESEMSNYGLNIVLSNVDEKGNKIFNTDSGSIVYKGDESKGLHTRVFVSSEGLPTYEAKELALAFKKFEDVNFDESVVITANEQSGYFKVVLDALSHLSTGIANRSKHVSHGMVKLPGAEKMSSRKGKIIEGEWLLNETRNRVETLMKESGKYTLEEITKVSDTIAVGAIKYAFLKVDVGRDVIFEFEKSISFDGDTGPYLQYVYARCNSILGQVKEVVSQKSSIELDVYSKELIRHISRYESVLLNSSLNYSPSTLCTYLFDLGQTFNKFYQNVRVLDSEDMEYLLTVVDATAKTIKHGLNVLGIDVVEKM